MRRQQVSKPRPLFEGETYLSVVALLLLWQAGQDLPIGAGHEDGEMLLVSDAAERFGGSIHCSCEVGEKMGQSFADCLLASLCFCDPEAEDARQSVG